MLRRAAGVLARQQVLGFGHACTMRLSGRSLPLYDTLYHKHVTQAALQEALGGTGPAPAWRALQQTRVSNECVGASR